jgi:hypothetical protein
MYQIKFNSEQSSTAIKFYLMLIYNNYEFRKIRKYFKRRTKV